MKPVNLDIEVDKFCKEFDLCPTKDEKMILKLAMSRGRAIQIELKIAEIKEKLQKLNEKYKRRAKE